MAVEEGKNKSKSTKYTYGTFDAVQIAVSKNRVLHCLPLSVPFGRPYNRPEYQVAGIDVYTHTTDQDLGHHIDFISRDCFSETVQWNTTNNNNGNATDGSEYRAGVLVLFHAVSFPLRHSLENIIQRVGLLDIIILAFPLESLNADHITF